MTPTLFFLEAGVLAVSAAFAIVQMSVGNNSHVLSSDESTVSLRLTTRSGGRQPRIKR